MQDRPSLSTSDLWRARLAGMKALGFNDPPLKKRLLIISETDGCFVDGMIAATGCAVGHRTLRIEDYGKVAATFVDTKTGQAMRVAPALNVREKAYIYAQNESRHYFAQMEAYQIMPDEDMFIIQEVVLNVPIEQIVSRAGVRVDCDMCGEEIMKTQIIKGLTLC
jgi:formylmethanofuran dehydrogenase subunit E